MRILFLLPDFPYPPTTGGRLKVFNVLKILSQQHQCDILCFSSYDDLDQLEISKVLSNVNILGVYPLRTGMFKVLRMFWLLLQGLPLSFAAFSGRKFKSKFKALLEAGRYDLVHYDIVNMAQYGLVGKEIPSIHSPNDATSKVYFLMATKTVNPLKKLQLLLSAFLLRRFEKRIYPLFTKIHVVSQADADYLRALNPAIDVSVIPIATNADYLSMQHIQKHVSENKCPPYRIIFTGNLGNHAIAKGLQDFLDEALPRIIGVIPNIEVVVLGQGISWELNNQINKTPQVKLFRWVDDYRSFISSADVVLIPDSIGPSGAKTRTVQAMGLGLTVVGSDVAFSGMSFNHLEHGLMYKTMLECADLILLLFNNPGLAKQLGKNANRLIQEEFSLIAVGPLYEALYKSAKTNFISPSFLLSGNNKLS